MAWLVYRWRGWHIDDVVGTSMAWLVRQWRGWYTDGGFGHTDGVVGIPMAWLVYPWRGWYIHGAIGILQQTTIACFFILQRSAL